jgi:hypothetical protein
MALTLPTLLVCAAALASLVLLAQHRPIGLPILAAVVAAFEALTAFHLVQLSVAHVPLPLFLGIALAIAGVACYVRAGAKSTVTAATIVAFIGILQTVSALHLR